MAEKDYVALHDKLEEFMNNYADVYQHVIETDDWKNPFRDIVSKDIPELLQACTELKEPYRFVGSYGKGRWTNVPWIAVFDTRITTSAQKGVYIVYLLNKDTKELYLTLNQSATSVVHGDAEKNGIKVPFTGMTGSSSEKDLNALSKQAKEIRQNLNNNGFDYDREINTGADKYDAGTIFYKKYTLDTLPKGEVIAQDLLRMVSVYSQYERLVNNAADDLWWPSKEEYDPGFTKEDWLGFLNDPDMIGPVWGSVLAMFYEQGGAATCSELGKIYNRNPYGISGNCTQLAMHIYKRTNCPILIEDGKKKYWPILFVGKDADSSVSGSFIWKLRSELYDAISESDIMKYLPNKAQRSWLLAWNPSFYPYDEYEEKRQSLLSGEIYVDEWACANTHVSIGDRVYLMRLGTGDRNGIIASGYADSESFKAPHYNPDRATQGDELNKIMVRFDHMLDRNGPEYLSQEVLQQKFPDEQWSPKGSGIEIKAKYRDDLEKEWLNFIGEDTGEEVEPEMTLTTKEALNKISDYIASKGFTYDKGLIENFYLCLKSKPFVILAGTSGTGKTRLVKLFAEAIDAKYKMVPVRPDWSDSSDLFGHLDLNGNYVRGEIIEFIADAQKHPSKPYILCLDEMNLARVEYYFSDFLSVIETRDLVDGEIVSDPLVSLNKYGDDQTAKDELGEIRFPQNLYLVGTVNMDETTFPFSKKVLDRANTIEFNYVDLLPGEYEFEKEPQKLQVPNDFLKTKYLLLSQCTDDTEFVDEISSELQDINKVLQKANSHIGYRIRDEIVFYMLNNKEAELLDRNEAFDNEIMQKILPRIQGSSVSVKDMLCALFKIVAGDFENYSTSSGGIADHMIDKIRKEKVKYPKSAEKIAYMVRRIEEDGFTSYWL